MLWRYIFFIFMPHVNDLLFSPMWRQRVKNYNDLMVVLPSRVQCCNVTLSVNNQYSWTHCYKFMYLEDNIKRVLTQITFVRYNKYILTSFRVTFVFCLPWNTLFTPPSAFVIPRVDKIHPQRGHYLYIFLLSEGNPQ